MNSLLQWVVFKTLGFHFHVLEHSNLNKRGPVCLEYIRCDVGLGLVMHAFSLFLVFLGSAN